jgi:hypothetical protein
MAMFWQFADFIRAAALCGGGFALLSTSFWGGAFICGAGAISLADVWRNQPEVLKKMLEGFR